mmetsp:Transcript_6379/g.18370  ORF Transcript_6379/g.18370 Transcript_6379/m.18370 type:complete len:202 (+) Transcript_6379:588-1193(+)
MPTCHHHVTHSSRCWLWSALIFAVSDTCHQSHCFMCAERDVAEMSLLGRLPSQCLEVGLSLQTNKRRKFHPLCAAHKGVAEPERKGQHRLQERSVHERIQEAFLQGGNHLVPGVGGSRHEGAPPDAVVQHRSQMLLPHQTRRELLLLHKVFGGAVAHNGGRKPDGPKLQAPVQERHQPLLHWKLSPLQCEAWKISCPFRHS